MGRRTALVALIALAGCREPIVPLVDHHQHLMSAAGARQTMRPGQEPEEQVSARQLVAMLDDAGIGRAVVLSCAYYFDGVDELGRPDTYEKVRRENDWTAEQVAQFPDRLVALCSFNPVADHALTEMRRCADSGKFVGLKLHFASTGTRITNPDHLERVRRVFRAANELRLPILAHVAAEGYGREHAEIIVNQILPEAPDVPVIIAHLWGGGAVSEAALGVYADAISSGHPATKRLYFDLAQATTVAGREDLYDMLARRIRQIGLDRMYYASDGPQFGGAPPRAMWKHFRKNMPLTHDELKIIANNVAPFVKTRQV